MKKTALHQKHIDAGGRMVEFGRWDMPVQYEGIIKEHSKVRTTAGLFDASHMGEIEITGEGAANFVNYILTNDISKASSGDVIYSLLLNDNGGTIDDLLVYCIADDNYLLVVNASNADKDLAWIRSKCPNSGVTVKDRSDEFALLALQGPNAVAIMKKVSNVPADLKYYSFTTTKLGGAEIIVSRTGYTGEDGFELYIPTEKAEEIWDLLLNEGEEFGIAPCGLAVRDLLRIEAGYPLYGHELSEEIDPLTAGIKWAVKKDGTDFIGKAFLDSMQKEKKRVGIATQGRLVPREGYLLFAGDKEIGKVVSGTFSPSLQKGIGMGYISRLDGKFLTTGEKLFVEIRGKKVDATIRKLPFVKHNVFKNG